jgi:PKD repeat protein
MQKLAVKVLGSLLLLALASCGGGGTPTGGGATSALDFTIAANPGSSVQATQVTGQYVDLGHPAYAWVATKLPAESTGLAGMLFAPETPAGDFSGILSAKLDTAKGTSAAVGNQRVDVWTGDKSGLHREAVLVTGADGSFNLPLDFLGLLIFATPQPGADFTVAAFADQSATGTGVAVNFHASAQNAQGAVTFAWDYGDGTLAAGAAGSHAYAVPGTYNVALSATDSAGNIAPAVSTPIVITSSAPPLTAATVTVTRSGPRNDFAFDYNSTLTGGLAPFTYHWDFDTANPGTDIQTTVGSAIAGKTFAAPGLYQGRLTFTDAAGDSVTSPVFESDNQLVPFIAAVSPAAAERGETVELQGDGFGTLDGADRVMLGSIQCVIDQVAGGWTDTSIKVKVPAAAVNADFTVITELPSNAVPFKVLPAAPGGPGGGQF